MSDNTKPIGIIIRAEVVAYLVLIGILLALRLAALGDVPLTNTEAREALSSWRVVYPRAPGDMITAESPLTFLLQSISFSLIGASEFAARILTALTGCVLAVSPLLFRSLLGRVRTFCLCLLLTLSPLLMAASREGSPVVLSALCAVLALWLLHRYWLSGRRAEAQMAIVAFGALIFLTEPGGMIFALILLIAVFVATSMTVTEASVDVPENDPAPILRERLQNLPLFSGLAFIGVVTLLVGTGFMLYQPGLGAVGEVIGRGLAGFLVPQSGSPMPVSLVYEVTFWVFGIAGVVIIFRRSAWTFIERFLIVWLALSIIASLIYSGAGVEHALWLTLPLAALAIYAIPDLFTDDQESLLWIGSINTEEAQSIRLLRSGRWLAMLAMLALLFMVAIHLRVVSSAFLNIAVPTDGNVLSPVTGLFDRITSGGFVNVRVSLVWLLISFLFMMVGYFLAASVLGNTTTLQGGALGLLIFGLVVGIGGGWRASVSSADDPAEIWHTETTTQEVFLLRQTLLDLAERQRGGFPEIAIAVMAPQDGAMAWAVRDFENARFINDVNVAAGEGIVILPYMAEPPPLGGGYVGQTFTLHRYWFGGMQLFDWFAWWTQRDVRLGQVSTEVLVLWLRQDVFEGIGQ